jgi:hypothetical protein
VTVVPLWTIAFKVMRSVDMQNQRHFAYHWSNGQEYGLGASDSTLAAGGT